MSMPLAQISRESTNSGENSLSISKRFLIAMFAAISAAVAALTIAADHSF